MTFSLPRKSRFGLAVLLLGLAMSVSAQAAETQAERLFSSIDVSSPSGPMPNPERTNASLEPIMKELQALGPLGLLEAGEGQSKLTLQESFADGSEIRRVYSNPLAASKAFADLDETPAGELKRGGYAYYSTVEGSYWSGGRRYGYRTTYGSHDGRSWTVLHHYFFHIP